MTKLTVEHDMKLGSALDQLEDALAAAYASLKMVQWARLNVARYAGSVVSPELNAQIRSMPLDIEELWALAQANRLNQTDEMEAIYTFSEARGCYALCMILAAFASMRHAKAATCKPAKVSAYLS